MQLLEVGAAPQLGPLSFPAAAASSMESLAGTAPTPRPAALPYYVAFSQLLGLTVVATTGAWLGLYRGGIAWESALQFNVHPLCMIIGLIFLQGDGELAQCSWEPALLRALAGTLSLRGLLLLDESKSLRKTGRKLA